MPAPEGPTIGDRFARLDREVEIVQRGGVGARRIVEFDVREFERPARRFGEGARLRGRGDARFGVEQLAQPFGGARGAQQVAIDLGQRAERARDQPAGEDESGDGAAGDRPRSDALGPVPQQGGDRAEQQPDDDRGHDRAQADAALGGRKGRLDRAREARRFALFLPERLDDLHRAQLFGRRRADVGDAILARPRDILQAAAEQDDRHDDHRDAEQDAAGQLGRQGEQIGDAADPHHHVAQRHRHGGADDLFDDRGVRRHPRGDFGRAVFLEKAGGEAEQVALHRLADVGDGAFAQPADEIEAQRGGERQRQDDAVEQAEMRRDVAAAGDKAAVDHFLELPGDRQRRERGDAERDRGDDQLQRVGAGIMPDHPQAAELAAGFGGGFRWGKFGGAGHRSGPSSGGARAQRRRMALRFMDYEARLHSWRRNFGQRSIATAFMTHCTMKWMP